MATDFANGKCHDFNLFKRSKLRMLEKTLLIVDTGYVGVKKLHSNTLIPRKASKNKKLTKDDKKYNTTVAKKRIFNENVIGRLKKFKVISDRYRNRRNRFELRFNLIAAIHNFEFGL